MTPEVEALAIKAGVEFFDYQVQALARAQADISGRQRRCLYYKTGAGKSLTALAMLLLWGHDRAVVITPPATVPQWQQLGQRLGMTLTCMSHAKFRMKDTKLSRTTAVVADEMHLFGGHDGLGWKKLDRLAASLDAPLVLASATPNYNDADRVYCIQHVLDPHSVRGGFLAFVYAHCETRQNPFGAMPEVTGFKRFPDAAAYLASLPGVEYLPDDLVYQITDVPVVTVATPELDTYGLNIRSSRIVASQIEERHVRVNLALVDDYGKVRDHIYEIFTSLVESTDTPTLVFANHASVAEALGASLREHNVVHAVVTGASPAKHKTAAIQDFTANRLDVLVGTATLATGTDGMDKMCDHLVILDDTDDDALRRQLIGRIMPRGADTDASKKLVHRLVLS